LISNPFLFRDFLKKMIFSLMAMPATGREHHGTGANRLCRYEKPEIPTDFGAMFWTAQIAPRRIGFLSKSIYAQTSVITGA
jgi:hypothetical protein